MLLLVLWKDAFVRNFGIRGWGSSWGLRNGLLAMAILNNKLRFDKDIHRQATDPSEDPAAWRRDLNGEDYVLHEVSSVQGELNKGFVFRQTYSLV
jgi:hypothetical protein